jgi:serine/threonine-protein kinase
MSPEQCLDHDLDGRCDVYSLGCVMYETLTGKPPLVGRTAFETMNKHLTEMPEKLANVRPDISYPMELEAIIRKALAKSPNDRWKGVSALQQALLALLKSDRAMTTYSPSKPIKLAAEQIHTRAR